jgi:tetratricopeptide (TPR) repeat protein
MKSKKAAWIACFLLFLLFCFQISSASAGPARTLRGVVITIDGTVVPEFSVVVKHVADKPELFQRKHFKKGEFTIDGLTADKYQLQISSPSYIPVKLDFDFKSKVPSLDHFIVILHTYRNERRLAPGAAYRVSFDKLQQKVPDAARGAYLKAIDLHREGRLEEALVEYGKALRAYPNYAEALSDMATIFILYNRPESALTFLRRAQDLDNSNVVTNLNVSIALTEQGDYGGAMKVLKKVLHDNPQMAIAHFYMGKIHWSQKKYADAQAEAEQATAMDPELLDAWLLVVNASLQQKKYDQAREALTHIRQSINNGKVTAFIDEQLSTLGS